MRFDGERKQWFAPSQDIATAAGNVFQPEGDNARH
jgi:hypothetical protein